MTSKDTVLSELRSAVATCKACGLHATRKNAVFGAGNINSHIVFVGEAPGYNEDVRGAPFVGAAGRVLDSLLSISGIKRDDVYITNVVKCRPPENRQPTLEEVKACSQYLKKQLATIRPRIVVALGRVAGNELLGRNVSISKEHGKTFVVEYGQHKFVLFVTYHPAAAIYNRELIDIVKADFHKLKEVISRVVATQTTVQ